LAERLERLKWKDGRVADRDNKAAICEERQEKEEGIDAR